jgi:hypothetical protein
VHRICTFPKLPVVCLSTLSDMAAYEPLWVQLFSAQVEDREIAPLRVGDTFVAGMAIVADHRAEAEAEDVDGLRPRVPASASIRRPALPDPLAIPGFWTPATCCSSPTRIHPGQESVTATRSTALSPSLGPTSGISRPNPRWAARTTTVVGSGPSRRSWRTRHDHERWRTSDAT